MFAYGHKQLGYDEISNWVDFGTVESYLKTNGDVLLNRYPWFDYSGYKTLRENILVHKNAIPVVKEAIERGLLSLSGYVIIGSNPAFYGNKTITIENAVIGHNVKLGNGAKISGIQQNGILYPSVLLDASSVFGAELTAAIVGYSSSVFSNGKKSQLNPYSVVGNGINLSSVVLQPNTRVTSEQNVETILETNRYNIVHFGDGLVFFSDENQRYNPFK
ncbi:MAG: hypothetical protein QXJ06_02345 [Candidatus Aenigmatarchaeota archaeon]